MGSIVSFSKNILKKYKNRLSEKINYILKYDEKALRLLPDEQAEQALPGSKKWIDTGYYKYMLSRYLFSIKYIKNKIVLDSGCGLGWGSYLISDFPQEIISIDINERALKFAEEKWIDAKLNFKKYSVLDLDNLNKKFDVILGFELIEHLTFSEGKRYLEQVFNNLNKKGVLILSSLFSNSQEEAKITKKQNKYHHNIFTKNELETITREIGFRRTNFIGNFMAVVKK